MPVGRIGAGSRASQFWNASGEATEQATLPTEFESNPIATSPIASHLQFATDHTSFVPGQPNAVVRRWPRMIGMRYLYVRGAIRMPIQRLGADGTPIPWRSAYQPMNQGPIHDAGFDDANFQAGYPGFNLGLSFKVPTVDRTAAQKTTRSANRLVSANPVSVAVNRLRQTTDTPQEREPT